MVKVKTVHISITALLAVGSAGVWFVISQEQSAQKPREIPFHTTKDYPTSGGQRMKPEW